MFVYLVPGSSFAVWNLYQELLGAGDPRCRDIPGDIGRNILGGDCDHHNEIYASGRKKIDSNFHEGFTVVLSWRSLLRRSGDLLILFEQGTGKAGRGCGCAGGPPVP